VLTRVLGQSGVLDRRETDEEADRWFLRFTVLCSRGQPDGRIDVLFSSAQDEMWKAIILAIRHLPMQQREAYLLCHGEGLDLRQLATAMDCSSSAAAKHLSAAEATLKPIAGDRLEGFALGLPGLMASLVPAPQVLEVEVSRVIRRRRRRIWIRQWVLLPAKAGMAIITAWVVWYLWRQFVR
jgi:hypothetical protein